MSKEKELLLKLKKLADEGVGGEKVNAEQLLQKLLKKHGLQKSDLENENIEDYILPFNGTFGKDLAIQVAYSVIGNKDDNKGVYSFRSGKKVLIKSTLAEFLEIEQKYNFYKHHLKKDLKLFYNAFVQSQNIFPPFHLQKEKKEKQKCFLTEEEEKMLALARNLEKHSFYKQLANKGGRSL